MAARLNSAGDDLGLTREINVTPFIDGKVALVGLEGPQ